MNITLTDNQKKLINTSFIREIDKAITQTPKIQSYRAPNLYPSSASVIDINNNIVGSCARKEFLRLCQPESIIEYGINELTAAKEHSILQYDLATQEYIFLSGNMWEDAVVALSQRARIFNTHHTKWQIPHLHISGELDILVDGNNFTQEKPVIIEMKTTSGIWNEKRIFIGGTPKDSNLLQVALYLYKFGDEVSGAKLVYYDRGAPKNRREFTIFLHINIEEFDGKKYKVGRISVDGMLIEDWTVNGILQRYGHIWDSYIGLNIPSQEFTPYYTPEIIKRKLSTRSITKSMASKIEDPLDSITNGDFQCNYCKYRELCVALQNDDVLKENFKKEVAKTRKEMHNIES